ncbi:hypothetical protein SUDANB2_05947 [Streptomyces sp. enrichment culture]
MRFVRSGVSATTARWERAFRRDGGTTRLTNWAMVTNRATVTNRAMGFTRACGTPAG